MAISEKNLQEIRSLNRHELPVYYFSQLPSTNNFFKEIKINSNALCFAEHQTQGRGQFTKEWLSNKEENCCFSIQFIAKQHMKVIPTLSLFIGYAISNTLKELFSLNSYLKYPNDLFVNGRKIAGILIESKSSKSAKNHKSELKIIIGVGLNVNQTIWSCQYENKITSLKQVLSIEINRDILLLRLVESIISHYKHYLLLPYNIPSSSRA